MRPISRTALGAAIAAVLAVTAVGPSSARPSDDGAPGAGNRPLTGSESAARQSGAPVTVTLVTGDRILVSTDAAGRSAATAMPREDGSQPLVQTRQSGEDLYVYPEGAVTALAAGKVDRELFNVTGLIRQGYDDAHAKKLPLIAVYDGSVNVARSAPPAPRGADRSRTLASIGAVALAADKQRAAAFWADVTDTRSRAAGGLRKLWLDGKVRANLERSTKQVNAPAAWAAGYDGKGTKVAVLDTGTDLEHPDLKGRVAASENFTDSDTDADRQGHGTHTISTVGGSGAESGGAKKGVAPGAGLLSGKVLNDQGYGLDSWIIAGMEWAVESKADVVSMSLGDPSQTACDDPMSAAAEHLARSTGTLFVIAAGNSGPGNNTVSSPGCAPSVLTVGAVDRDDTTAPFSSRGPAGPQHTLKPEIAAPGVGISAAAMGGRGVYAYQSMSGTSMATPHVAGAAAIVKQRHPDWTAQQIKAALVGSANTAVPGDVRQTGGGRLDVKAAIDTAVIGAPAVQGGTYHWPQERGDRTGVEIPYTNTGSRPVTLDLAVEKVTGNDGSAVRSRIARLERRTVTVPAGATVKVPLALDPAARLERSQYGDVTGRVVATANGARVSTPFSLYVEPETVTLRVKLIDRWGKPAAGPSSLDVIGTDDASGERRFNEGAADQVYRVRPGSYFLSAFVATLDAGEGATLYDSLTYLGRPQLEVRKDTVVTLDARKAARLSIETERPTEARNTTLAFARHWDDTWLHAGTAAGGRTIRGYYASVEGRADDGAFEFGSYWRAAAPLVSELKAAGGGPVLHPITASTGSDNLDGTGSAPLVDAGAGTAEELAAAGAKGAIVLVKAADDSLYEVANRAKGAGAKAVLAHRDAPGRWVGFTGYAGGSLPALTVDSAEAKALLERLAGGKVTLAWKAAAKSPYVYNLAQIEQGQVRGERTYRVRDRDLGAAESTYHAMGVGADFMDLPGAYRPLGNAVFFGGLDTVAVPGKRTEYYTPGDTAWEHLVSSSFPWGEFMTDQQRTYAKGGKRSESWYDGVIGPVAPRDASGRAVLAAERQGNLIGFAPAMWGDSGHYAQPGSFGDIGGLVLKRDGEQIGESWYPSGVFEVPAGEATYELTQQVEKIGAPARTWQRSRGVVTSWTFRSKADPTQYSQGLPILFPALTVPEDGMKALAAKDGQTIGLGATGHAGYRPGALKSAKLAYSYDGEHWTQAKVGERDGRWTAVVDHAGAGGRPVTLRVELTDANGASVTQTVARAYDVR
ncbi:MULTISPECIES: S8 family serine peptidase [unclassified Streptomyces]|uniref:S8 family peptidase n=1 Tax=unclassified Streptomyces TaxID=2593676 RepID=UPI0022514261|nr:MULTISPECIES: S8 family serine peptidase [unclassified Streptomyces]MCX4528752.1 S8 family serine peptidase [Streptomyces sp. NBC_01551]MCX4540640.1 S8 family serine peptidase [Streptomyces sp. NBC_01565]